jgi:hypothetical protein
MSLASSDLSCHCSAALFMQQGCLQLNQSSRATSHLEVFYTAALVSGGKIEQAIRAFSPVGSTCNDLRQEGIPDRETA